VFADREPAVNALIAEIITANGGDGVIAERSMRTGAEQQVASTSASTAP
jgi:hypothetical protein